MKNSPTSINCFPLTLVLFLTFSSAISQCYNREGTQFLTQLPQDGYYDMDAETLGNLRAFYSTNFEVWKSSEYNGFCIEKNLNPKYTSKIIMGIEESILQKNDDKKISSIISKLLFYEFLRTQNHEFDETKMDYLSDMFSGYYYGFNEINKNWGKIYNNNSEMISMSKKINEFTDWYSSFLEDYKLISDINVQKGKRTSAFLKGIYLSMPIGFRQNISSEVYCGNEIPLLMDEIVKLYDFDKESSIMLQTDDLIFSFKESDKQKVNCEIKSLVPMKFAELNDQVKLNYLVSDNCYFQPLHIEVNKDNPFTIIGRFNGKAIDDSSYALEGIELKFFEASAKPNPIIVQDAWVDPTNTDDNLVTINISLLDLSKCESNYCTNKLSKLEKGDVDFQVQNLNISVTENTILDFHLVNLKEVYPDMKEGDAFFPRGRHCNGKILFD